jgi:hypothetical protein
MNLRTKFLAFTGVAAASLAITVAPAFASDADVVVFQGRTTALGCDNGTLPPQPVPPPIGGTPNCHNNALPIVGGSGGYTFTGNCLAGVSTEDVPPALGGDPDGPLPEVFVQGVIGAGCTINSTGRYINVVCGTGAAFGAATIAEGGSDTYNINYTIVFVGTVGVLVGTGTEGPDDGDPGLPVEPVVGVVQLSAGVADLALPGDCVTAFNVLGAAATTL